MNYWEIVLWDGEIVKVRPENVELIQKKIASGEGAINTPTRSIVIKSIKDFRETSERYTNQALIESSAQAFNEPIIENDSVMCRWMKRSVPRREYSKNYAGRSRFRKLSDNESYVTIMWLQPIHLITQEMEELTQDEERMLSR